MFIICILWHFYMCMWFNHVPPQTPPLSPFVFCLFLFWQFCGLKPGYPLTHRCSAMLRPQSCCCCCCCCVVAEGVPWQAVDPLLCYIHGPVVVLLLITGNEFISLGLCGWMISTMSKLWSHTKYCPLHGNWLASWMLILVRGMHR